MTCFIQVWSGSTCIAESSRELFEGHSRGSYHIRWSVVRGRDQYYNAQRVMSPKDSSLTMV